jgi:hypothetical protein
MSRVLTGEGEDSVRADDLATEWKQEAITVAMNTPTI